MQIRRFTRSLPCKLTDSERRLRGVKLAEANHERAEIELRKKDASAGFREELKANGKRIEELSEQVSSGVEKRPVECCERPDEDRQVVEIYRVDTGAVIDTRPMTLDERQPKLFPLGGADDGDDDTEIEDASA